MKRWDSLVDGYLEQCRARGLTSATREQIQRELDRWGSWMKHRRPRPNLETVGSEMLVQYIRGRTRFRAKATVSGTMSVMRGMGDHLMRAGIWLSNPLRWMRGPKLDWRMHLPRRIAPASMTQLWESASKGCQRRPEKAVNRPV